MRIVIKVLPILLATTLGCIAQAGDPNGGPDEQTGTSAQALGANGQRAVQQQQRVAPNEPPANMRSQPGTKELISGPGTPNGGDPSQDPGDDNEPVPQPWAPHTSSSRVSH